MLAEAEKHRAAIDDCADAVVDEDASERSRTRPVSVLR